jgi:hypothetical protein
MSVLLYYIVKHVVKHVVKESSRAATDFCREHRLHRAGLTVD